MWKTEETRLGIWRWPEMWKTLGASLGLGKLVFAVGGTCGEPLQVPNTLLQCALHKTVIHCWKPRHTVLLSSNCVPHHSTTRVTVCPHFFSLFWHIAFLWTVYTQVSVCGLHSKLGEGICKGVSTCSTVTRQKTITLMFPSDSVENPFWWFKLWPEWIDSELSEPESGTKRDRTPHSVSSLWTPVEKRIIDDYAPVGTTLSNWTLFVRIGGTRSLGLAFNE